MIFDLRFTIYDFTRQSAIGNGKSAINTRKSRKLRKGTRGTTNEEKQAVLAA